jgi:hypothetical protein
MPYDRRHVLAQWGGTLPGGEIWSNSIRLAGDTTGNNAEVPTQGDLIAWLEGPAKDAVAAFHADPNTGIHSAAKLVFLKMNVVDVNGHYIEQTTHEWVYSPVVAGGSSANLHPNQCTLVVSTTTAFERGPAHRGRFYLPLCAKSIETASGGISTGEAMLVATAAATFLSALHDQPGLDPTLPGDMHVCVMSSVGAGATNRITGCEVGTVVDTQRRRRNAQAENYQRAALV